jgi:hypothetical protein
MTAFLIGALGALSGFALGLAIARRGYAGWRAEIEDHTASLKLANSVIEKMRPLAETGRKRRDAVLRYKRRVARG